MKPSKSQLESLIVRAVAAGPIAGFADLTDNSLVVGAAATTAVVVDAFISRATARRHQQIEVCLDVAAQFAKIDTADFAVRIVSNDHIMELAIMLLEAASRTADKEHFLMLAKLLADGSFIEDVAETDSFAYIARTVARLDSNHLRALKSLGEVRDSRHENYVKYNMVTRYIATSSIREAILNDVVTNGLAKGFEPNEINAQVKAELSISYDSRVPAAYSLTSFGREVYRRLKEAGESETLD